MNGEATHKHLPAFGRRADGAPRCRPGSFDDQGWNAAIPMGAERADADHDGESSGGAES